MNEKIDKLDEGERLEKDVENQNIDYSASNNSDTSRKIRINVQNDVFNTLNTSNGGSMQDNSYESQIQMVQEFQEKLMPLRKYLIEIRDEYKKQIDIMEARGFVSNIISPLRTKYQTFSLKISEIERHLESDNKLLEKPKEELQRLITTARGN